MKRFICWLLGHPAGVREQLRLHTNPVVIPGTEDAEQVVTAIRNGWYTWWTGYHCTRCGAWYR